MTRSQALPPVPPRSRLPFWRNLWAQYLTPAQCDEAEAGVSAMAAHDARYTASVLGEAVYYRIGYGQPLDVALSAIRAQMAGGGR